MIPIPNYENFKSLIFSIIQLPIESINNQNYNHNHPIEIEYENIDGKRKQFNLFNILQTNNGISNLRQRFHEYSKELLLFLKSLLKQSNPNGNYEDFVINEFKLLLSHGFTKRQIPHMDGYLENKHHRESYSVLIPLTQTLSPFLSTVLYADLPLVDLYDRLKSYIWYDRNYFTFDMQEGHVLLFDVHRPHYGGGSQDFGNQNRPMLFLALGTRAEPDEPNNLQLYIFDWFKNTFGLQSKEFQASLLKYKNALEFYSKVEQQKIQRMMPSSMRTSFVCRQR